MSHSSSNNFPIWRVFALFFKFTAKLLARKLEDRMLQGLTKFPCSFEASVFCKDVLMRKVIFHDKLTNAGEKIPDAIMLDSASSWTLRFCFRFHSMGRSHCSA